VIDRQVGDMTAFEDEAYHGQQQDAKAHGNQEALDYGLFTLMDREPIGEDGDNYQVVRSKSNLDKGD